MEHQETNTINTTDLKKKKKANNKKPLMVFILLNLIIASQ
jgi:hypothetical protein